MLKAAYKFADENGVLARNPISPVHRPTVASSAPTSWSSDEAKAFLNSVESDRLYALWSLALTRGRRRGELCGLRWDAIDLGAGTLRIIRTRVTVYGETYESTPKTTAGRRTVPLDPALASRLIDRRRQQAAERLRAGSAWTDSGYVFADALGRPYPPEHLTGRFEVLVKASKLPRITLHGTRHTAASLMLADGVQPKVVQELLGHSHVSVTLGIYGHVTPSMGQAAGASLSARLLG